MSRQLSIDTFFPKSKGVSLNDVGVSKMPLSGQKRANRALKSEHTPSKSPKLNNTVVIQEVISLDSDSDGENRDIFATCPNQWDSRIEVLPNSLDMLESSGSTILYSPETPNTTQQEHTPKTPKSSPSILQDIRSPLKQKFFSPTKKRGVRKNLSRALQEADPKVVNNGSSSLSTFGLSNQFIQSCNGMDDKTIFLLTIINRYVKDDSVRHLLESDSQILLENCLRVVKPGMRLICRLYWRKEGWYKMDKIKEIISNEQSIDSSTFFSAIASLEEYRLIEKGSIQNMNIDDFIGILTREELKEICKELKLKVQSKQDSIEALLSFSRRKSNISSYFIGCTSDNFSRVLQIMNSKAGPCYRLTELTRSTLYKLHVLMYLGMDYSIIRDKRLELVLLYDKIKRETYPVDKELELDSASVVFKSRDEFERYMSAHSIYEDFLAAEANERCDSVKQVYELYKEIKDDEMRSYKGQPSWLRRYTPAHIYVKILEQGVQDLKRDKTEAHYELAMDILTTLINQTAFRQHRKAEWIAEKALILHNSLSRYDEAAELLLEGFKLPISEEAKDCMRPRSKKIATQKNTTLSDHLRAALLDYATKDNILEYNLESTHIYKQPMDRVSPRGKVKFERRSAEGRAVQEAEQYCIAQYLLSGEFTHGEHWEGRIVTTIFFLLFWDIIYSKPGGVPGIFLSHYQLYPLDLLTEDFYRNRKSAVDIWLKVIETSTMEDLLDKMQDTWNKRPEHELSGICRAIGWANVRAVASCLGARALARLCRRLAAHHRHARAGFPDLTMWNVNTGHIKFIEVKTDSDKPSMKQLQWMHYLRENSIDTGFCYVGAKTTRQKSRTATNKTNSPKKPKIRKPNIKRVKSEVKNESAKKEVKTENSDSEDDFVTIKTEV